MARLQKRLFVNKMKTKNQILVIGIGNVIRADDGLGIYLARRLREILPEQRYKIKELTAVERNLIDEFADYRKVILIDAIKTTKGIPGQIYHFSSPEFKSSFNLSSSHALDLNQMIKLGQELMGKGMPEVEVLAVEAKRVNDYSEELSPELQNQFENILQKIKDEIERIK